MSIRHLKANVIGCRLCRRHGAEALTENICLNSNGLGMIVIPQWLLEGLEHNDLEQLERLIDGFMPRQCIHFHQLSSKRSSVD